MSLCDKESPTRYLLLAERVGGEEGLGARGSWRRQVSLAIQGGGRPALIKMEILGLEEAAAAVGAIAPAGGWRL